MRIHILLSVLIAVAMFAGCAEIDTPRPDQLIKDPFGESSLRQGMTKIQVEQQYGGPTLKRMVIASDWNGPREEWFYKADFSALPVGTGYLNKDLYLYFDGENLTNISRKSLGKVQEETKDAEENIK